MKGQPGCEKVFREVCLWDIYIRVLGVPSAWEGPAQPSAVWTTILFMASQHSHLSASPEGDASCDCGCKPRILSACLHLAWERVSEGQLQDSGVPADMHLYPQPLLKKKKLFLVCTDSFILVPSSSGSHFIGTTCIPGKKQVAQTEDKANEELPGNLSSREQRQAPRE